MSERPKEIPQANLRLERDKYVYDFGTALSYSDPKALALSRRITDRFITSTRSPWFNRMGFALKSAVHPDGGGESFMDLHVPTNAPREMVEAIFAEINASGLAHVTLSTEKYPEQNPDSETEKVLRKLLGT